MIVHICKHLGSPVAVKSAQRVLDILQMFAADPTPAPLGEIARILKLPKSSCFALLQTLEGSGYLYQLRGGHYYPTTRWLADATRISSRDQVLKRVRPVLETLRDETGETLLFAKRVGLQALYLDIVESRQITRYTAEVGQTKPLHCSASGHALLGGMEAADREALIRRLPMQKLTDHTVVDRKALGARIAASAERGWFHSLREYHPETAAVGVPVRIDCDVYAVLVAAPYQRLGKSMAKAGAKLIAATRSLDDAAATNHGKRRK